MDDSEAAQEPVEAAVDRAECIGAGQCAIVAPMAFRLDESMKAEVLNPADESLEQLLEAAYVCPARAIYLSRGRKPLYP